MNNLNEDELEQEERWGTVQKDIFGAPVRRKSRRTSAALGSHPLSDLGSSPSLSGVLSSEVSLVDTERKFGASMCSIHACLADGVSATPVPDVGPTDIPITSYALVVGMSYKFRAPAVQPLKQAVTNAKSMALFLRLAGYHVTTLLDAEATNVHIRHTLKQITDEIAKSDKKARLVLYFCGRGYIVNQSSKKARKDSTSSGVESATENASPLMLSAYQESFGQFEHSMRRQDLDPQQSEELTSELINCALYCSDEPMPGELLSNLEQKDSGKVSAAESRHPPLRPAEFANTNLFEVSGPSPYARWAKPIVISDILVPEYPEQEMEEIESKRRKSLGAVDSMGTSNELSSSREENLLLSYAEQAEKAKNRPTTLRSHRVFAQVMSESLAYSTLSTIADGRHFGAFTHYWLRGAEGRCGAPTFANVNSYIQENFLRRELKQLFITTNLVSSSPPSTKTSEFIVPLDRVPFKEIPLDVLKDSVERRSNNCRFAVEAIVALNYRKNPNVFISLLTKRFEEVANPPPKQEINEISKSTFKKGLPLQVWNAETENEVRFYFPAGTIYTQDHFRSEMRQLISASAGAGIVEQQNTKLALAALSGATFRWCASDNCAVLNFSSHSKATGGSAAARQDSGFNHNSNLDRCTTDDFAAYFAESVLDRPEVDRNRFLRHVRVTERIRFTVGGSEQHFNRFMKCWRLGLLETAKTLYCHITDIKVFAQGGVDEEFTAAIAVQKFVRAMSTRRLMKPRIAAAGSYIKSHHLQWRSSFDTFTSLLQQLFDDFQDGMLLQIEREENRQRQFITSEWMRATVDTFHTILLSWEHVESDTRFLIVSEELAEFTLFEREVQLTEWLLSSAERCRHIKEWSALQVAETRDRKKIIAERFGESMKLRTEQKEAKELVIEYGAQQQADLVVHRRSRRRGSGSHLPSLSQSPSVSFRGGSVRSRSGSASARDLVAFASPFRGSMMKRKMSMSDSLKSDSPPRRSATSFSIRKESSTSTSPTNARRKKRQSRVQLLFEASTEENPFRDTTE